MKHILFGLVYLVGGIAWKNILFHRTLQSFSNDGVIMNDRVGSAVVGEDTLIEILDVLRCDVIQPDSLRLKIGNHPGADQIFIALISSDCNGRSCGCQPLVKILGEFQSCIRWYLLDLLFFNCKYSYPLLLLTLIVTSNLFKSIPCLSFTGTLDREFGRDPFGLTLSVNLQIQNGVI